MIALSCCPRPSSSLPANYTHVGSAAPCQIHNYPAFHWHQRHQVEVWKTKNQQDATTHLLGGSLTVQLALIFFGSFLLSFVVRGHKEVHWSWLVINCTLKSIFAFMDFWVSQAGWKMNSGLTGKFKDLIKKFQAHVMFAGGSAHVTIRATSIMYTLLLWVTRHSGHCSWLVPAFDAQTHTSLSITCLDGRLSHCDAGAHLSCFHSKMHRRGSQLASWAGCRCWRKHEVSLESLSKASQETHLTPESRSPISFHIITIQIKITCISGRSLESLITCQWFMHEARFLHLWILLNYAQKKRQHVRLHESRRIDSVASAG